MELVKKYLKNTICGVPVVDIIDSICDGQQNGFWIEKNYFNCVSKLFYKNNRINKRSSRHITCYSVIKEFGIINDTTHEWPACKTCFKQCSEKYLHGELDVAKQYK